MIAVVCSFSSLSHADEEVAALRLAFSRLKPKIIKLDRNFDGIIDRAEFFDQDGNLFKTESDTSNVGILDEIVYYKNNVPLKAEKDHNADSRIDHIMYFDDSGIIKTATFDTNYDGEIDVWAEYRNGLPFKLQKDTNYDGKIDQSVSYDENGNVEKTEQVIDADDLPAMWRKDDAENILFFHDGSLY